MSVARNFRVTVNLSNFFHDHRNRARIFINEDIQRISDLEERIEKIFNVQNFHLTSQNEFLPPSEDARILQKDDIVWVIHNGENYDSTGTSNASNRNFPKPKRNEEKKSTPLADEFVGDELNPPKKKKKKYDFEKSEENVSSPINYEPKKKKKKKEKPDIVNRVESIDDINMEVFNSSNQNKSEVNVSNNTSTINAPQDELNSSKNNCMNINTLLPVLQSHINTYNKKMSTSQLNKPNTSTRVSSPSFLKKNNSDDERSRYTCKGNLPFYKKKTQLPTTTDEYLTQKKVNIVKIEYLSSALPNTKNNGKDISKMKNNETNEDRTSDICSIPMIVEELDKTNIADDCVPSRIFSCDGNMEGILPMEGITPLQTPDSSEALNTNNSLNILNYDLKNADEQYIGDVTTNTLSDKNCIPDSNDHNSKQEERNNAEEYCTDKEIIVNDTDLLCPSKDVLALNEKSKIFVPPTSSPCKISREITPPINDTDENSAFTSQNCSVPTNQDLLNAETRDESISDGVQAGELNTEIAPSQLENPNLTSTEDQLSEPNDSEFLHPHTKRTTDGLDFPHANHTDLDMRPSYKQNENVTSPNTALDQNLPVDDSLISNSYMENLAEDSTVEMSYESRISGISPIDLTTSVASKVTSPQISTVQQNSMSRYSRRKQESGVGQLLEDLRSNDSIISLESVDSDVSEFITKRQRKRVRKRKKKNANNSSLTDTSVDLLMVESPVQLKALNLKSSPAKHIIFEEDKDGEDLKAIDITKRRNPISTPNVEKVLEDSYMECVSLRSDLEESKIDKPDIKIEDILKSPSMNKMLPKVADLIAFKILRISENYTPEVSTFIVGKVLEFNTANKHILFEILSGLDQCQDETTFSVQGKLFLEDDKSQVVETLDNRRDFMWIDLIDPRLLYP